MVVPSGLEPEQSEPKSLVLPLHHGTKTGSFLEKKIGGDDETRTHYLDNANVALYQMSYAPKGINLSKK